MSITKIGMIGYNEGNGHPYSFSAIINGYNESAFSTCPFPVINSYLKARRQDEFGIGNLRVSHIWTPFPEVSTSIASFAFIEAIVDQYEQMLGAVDAVILARDDAESHREIASVFLEAGVKVFIDKPLCKTEDDLRYFIPFLRKGQLMSCSGLRYYPQIQDLAVSEAEILFAHCVAPLDWFKYGIHAIEGVIPLFRGPIISVQNIGEINNDIVRIEFENGKFILVQVNGEVAGGIRASLYSSRSNPHFVHYNDNFTCFKRQLYAFWELISQQRIAIDPNETIMLIKAIIAAAESRLNKNKIYLNHGY